MDFFVNVDESAQMVVTKLRYQYRAVAVVASLALSAIPHPSAPLLVEGEESESTTRVSRARVLPPH